MATVFCVLLFFSRLLEALQANEDPSSFQNSCADLVKRFGSLESNGNSRLLSTSTSTKRSDCFTCCVSGFVLPTIKEIPSLLFIIIQVVKVWNQKNSGYNYVISCKDFVPTTDHRVCSLHTWTSCHIWMWIAKPTPTNYGLTIKAQNITRLCITEYSSGFISLLLKQPGTQHVKPPLLYSYRSMKEDCCSYFQGCQTSWSPLQEFWKEQGSSLACTASKRRQRKAAHSLTTVAMLDCFPAVTSKTRISRAHHALWRHYA